MGMKVSLIMKWQCHEYLIFLDSSMVEHTAVNRGVAGSSPAQGVRLHGQVVKTPPFHGGNRGSNPLGVIKKIRIIILIFLQGIFLY